jgi:chitodextrinase
MPKNKQTTRRKHVAKTTRNSKKTSWLNRSVSDSRLQRLAFISVFALVGVIFAYFAFAATASTSFSGVLNKKNLTRSHSVTTTASGSFTATGTVTKGPGPLTLKLKTSNGTVVTQATGSPAVFSAPVGIGDYSIEVSGTGSGNTNYTVNVTYPVADTTPTLDTTPPSTPAGLTATSISTTQINLAWQSSTDNVGVSGYDVFRNGVKVSTTMTTSYADVNLTPATAYSYSVKSRDAAGNLSMASNTATATTQAPAADTTLPSVSITSPANGATVTGTVNASGNASDNVGLSKVEVQIGTGSGFVPANYSSTAVTWSYSLNTTLFTDGTYIITAKATDTSGNQKTASISLTIKNNVSTGSAPNTQGTWVSPEGATLTVNSAGTDPATGQPWTIAGLYQRLKNEAAAPGDFAMIAPGLKVNLQDTTASTALTSARSSGGVFYQFNATISLKGISSTHALRPDEVTSHEYGHAWTMYHLYITQQSNWNPYLTKRWVTDDGSITLAQDSRLNTSYGWDSREIIGDDYRLMFGSLLGVSQRPTHMNSYIAEPSVQPGLRDWFLHTWAKQP